MENVNKSLKDLSWQVSEEEYRADPALSYSTLAKYEREGFNNLDRLFDKIDTPSLTFGSAVDSIITGGQEEFNERFIVADFPNTSDSIIKIVKSLFSQYGDSYRSLTTIPDDTIIKETEYQSYQMNWKPETRAKVIKEKGSEYYNLLFLSQDKAILNNNTYNDVLRAVEALRCSSATSWYFQEDDPFDNSIERLYQLKFKATFNGVDYRCMMDECVVDYTNKTIQPIDLKTSYKNEWDFYKSFVEWNYQIQNRLYYRILKANIEKDEYFKDFKILPYKDIVVCRNSLTPLVWDCDFTFAEGTLTFGKNNQIIMRDPFEIGEELNYYLSYRPIVPNGIDLIEGNDLRKWLNTL